MATPPYVELHCHSGYSFLDGASHLDELVARAVELGQPALALTDHDGLYGSMEFAHKARGAGLQPVTGVELTLRGCFPGARPDAGDGDAPPYPAEAKAAFDEPEHHVTLLAETPTGYANLCRLVTRTHMESPREDPRLPLDALLDPGAVGGILLLTGCRRSPLAAALESSVADGEAFARRLVAAFGPRNVYVELQDNRVKGDASRNRALGALADRLELPVVATGDVHYHRREKHRLQDVLVAIRNRATLDGSHGIRRPNSLFHLASAEEMARRFQGREDALAATLAIAERCAAFDLTEDLGYTFPDFEGSERGAALETLAAVCLAELARRYPTGHRHETEARERLHQELKLVDLHGLAGFFLVYKDIMDLAREVAADLRGASPRGRANLPPGRGRGSSVSSIICYLIGLSNVDPVKADLFLGRFLNEALRSVPDIDLDFPRDIREALMLRVYARYGAEHVGLVATFPTYRMRSAVREVGKALDLPHGDLEKLAKLADHYTPMALRAEMERAPELAEKLEAPLWKALVDVCEDIAGLPRHISQHVGGMVISSRPLVEMVPLEPAAMEGRVLCQWDKDACDDAGFIKIDFLALGMLSLVEDAVDLIAVDDADGEPPDLSRIDFEDEAVYDRICSGDTVGMFQVESRAQIQMIRRVRPRNLDDLAVQVAIVRPGPIVGGAVNPYVRRREMLREDPTFKVPYDHPLLEEALGETLGVIIFQDQVLKVAQALAGFSDGQAEELRRAMSRKRSKEALSSHWRAFWKGAAERGVELDTARKVFTQVVAFSEFGFPKSHAHAFGLLAYQSAWLRHYHPTAYYVALFNNQPMGFYSLDALGRDARRHGVDVLLPDVNRSGVRCTVEDGDLRVGLGFVRGWGEEVARRVVEERDAHGPYRSLVDFLRRTPAALKRPAVENLVWVGGFDALGLTRRELLWQAGLWLGPESDPDRTGGRDDHPQTELALDEPYADLRFPDLDDPDRLVAEYRMLHFSASLHPLSLLRGQLPPDTVTSDRFDDLPDRSTVRVAGLVVARQRPATAKGYVFVLMEDESGHINVIVKPDLYEKTRSTVRMEPFLLVRGRLQKDGATMNVIALEVEAIRLDAPVGGRLRADLHGVPDARSAPAEELHADLPPTQEYWGNPAGVVRRGERSAAVGEVVSEEAGARETWSPQWKAKASAFRYLTALRQDPPGIKSFG